MSNSYLKGRPKVRAKFLRFHPVPKQLALEISRANHFTINSVRRRRFGVNLATGARLMLFRGQYYLVSRREDNSDISRYLQPPASQESAESDSAQVDLPRSGAQVDSPHSGIPVLSLPASVASGGGGAL